MAWDDASSTDFVPQQQSKFLQLPAELRNAIYRTTVIPDGADKHLQIWPYSMLLYSPLLKVCKQTRFEASSIFYQENQFSAAVSYSNIDSLRSWLQVIGRKNVDRISRLSIEYLPDGRDNSDIRQAQDRQQSEVSGLPHGSVLDGIYARQELCANALVNMLLFNGVEGDAITAPDVSIMAMGSKDARFFGQLVDLHWKWSIDAAKRAHEVA